jgi:phosphoserine phosphatase RsbU/P
LVAAPDAGGFPIAMFDAAEYEESCIQLERSDRLCLFSDGVIEQNNAAGGDQFGVERLMKSLTVRRTVPAEQAALEAVNDLTEWAGTSSFTDDVSLVIVEWAG